MIKVYTLTSVNSNTFVKIGVCIREHKIASYLKLKKVDRLFVSSAFCARIRPETFLKVRPEPELGP